MAHDIFISYKSQYVGIVKAIAHVLESDGIRCWYAPRDLDQGRSGYDYDDSILLAISESKAVVVVLTNEALTSEWVKIEIGQAQKKGKVIIPYVVNEITKENGLLMRLQNKHWIDAYPNPERKFSLLLNNVKLLLNESFNTDGNNTAEPHYTITEDINDTDFDYEEGIALYEAKEYEDAITAFAAAAERGNKKAADMICKMLYDLPNPLDIISKETWDILERQAKAGKAYACFAMHIKYYRDYENYYISFDYLKKAVSHAPLGLAFLRLGIHYGWGMGVKPNHTLSMHYYKKAIEAGCIQAYSYMGQEYEYGNDKAMPDSAKALEFYKTGAENNDSRSITRLADCYAWGKGVNKDHDEAIRLYLKAVELGSYNAYCDIGNCYEMNDDTANASKYYRLAAQHDEGEAFGNLARIAFQKSEKDEAYRWAKSGFKRKNGYSAYILGFMYEYDDKYEDAWKCYFERYKWVGAGAEDLARLYLEKEYRPENASLSEIVSMLDISARNGSEESLDALINIYSDENMGLKDSEKVYECIKLGAAIGLPEKMYKYGLSFMGEKEELFNGFKGLEWIEKAARKEYVPAVIYLIEAFSGDKYDDTDKLAEWCHVAARLHIDDDTTYTLVCRELVKAKAGNELKEYLTDIIENSKETMAIKALTDIFSKYSDGMLELNDEELEAYRTKAFKYLDTSNNDSITHLKRIAYKIDKDFKPFVVELNQILDGPLFEKYYNYFWAQNFKTNNLERKDLILSRLFAPIATTVSFDAVKELPLSSVSNAADFWDAPNYFFDYYEKACTRFSIPPVEYKRLEMDDLYPFISCQTAVNFGRDVLRCFLSLFSSHNDYIEQCSQPMSSDEILVVAEKCDNTDLQMLMIGFVEVNIEVEAVLLQADKLLKSYTQDQFDELAMELNTVRALLNAHDIENSLPEFEAQQIKALFDTPSTIESEPLDD